MSVLFPGSADNAGFWRDIVHGRDLVGDVPPTHWLARDYHHPEPGTRDLVYCARGAFLTPVPFDPLEFAIPPAHLPSTDTSQLLALLVAKRLLDGLEQGGRVRPIDRQRVSVLLGVASATELAVEMNGRLQHPVWARALRRHGVPETQAEAIMQTLSDSYAPWNEATFPGLLGNVVAGRIANRLDLGGTNCVVDAACASSLSALWLAALELDAGRTDLAITGGVDTINDIFMYMCFSKTTALSPTGDARPFSRNADGTVLGEGVGMLALRRLADAERDGDTIYAVVRGIGTASDGAGGSVYAPLAPGQVRALERAYADAGYSPTTVDLVEAHGTGTVEGDRVELQALRQVFARAAEGEGRPVPDAPACAIGSIKSQIGHTKAAAGSASLFKAVMAVHHGILPPTIKAETPHPDLAAADSPFYLNTRARPWIRGGAQPRRASVSAFGFGGSNYHVTLEEYVGPGRRPPKVRTLPAEWVAMARDDVASLADAIDAMLSSLDAGAGLAELAQASQKAFDARKVERVAVVASDPADLAQKLRGLRSGLTGGDPAATPLPGVYRGRGAAAGPIAFLFPGQGSQYVDMGADIAMAFDAARSVWDEADGGGDAEGEGAPRLSRVVFPPPATDEPGRRGQMERLTRTQWAQPAIGVVTLAYLRLLGDIGVAPAMVVGHSFGEVSALAAAGAMAPDTMLRVARLRGRLMAEHAEAHPGAMVAVFDPPADLEARLVEAHPELCIANRNAPGQVALSGPPEAVAALEAELRQRAVRHQRLAVGAAFHTPALAAVAGAFEAGLSAMAITAPSLPVYGNATARPYEPGAAAVTVGLADQIARPVRFADAVEAMYADGARLFLEVGPGNVLSGLARRTLKDRPSLALSVDRPGMHGVTALWHALAALSVAGIVFDTQPLWREYEAPAAARRPARRPSPATVLVGGANLGKPYPWPGAGDFDPVPLALPARPAPATIPPPAHAAPVPSAPSAPSAPSVAGVGPSSFVPFEQEARMQERDDPGAMPSEADSDGNAGPHGERLSVDGLASLRALQADLTRAHVAYQQALSEGHAAFLRTAETSMRLLLGGTAAGSDLYGGARPVAVPAVEAAPARPVAPADPVPMAASVPTPPALPPAPVPGPVALAAAPMPAPPERPVDPWIRVRAIVAEKTGYPETMLEPHLDLQADLGIDSIKRVEIVSAVQQEDPGFESFDAGRLASLRTLADVVEAARAAAAVSGPPVGAGAEIAAPGVRVASVPVAREAVDPLDAVLETVAEKTGYPRSMLEASLALDADLGIDSIKKVEIFSALQSRMPEAGTMDAQDIATLRTLDDVAAFLRRRIRGPAPAAPGPVAGFAPDAALCARPLAVRPAPATGGRMAGLGAVGELALVGGDPALATALVDALSAHGIAAAAYADRPPRAARGVIFLGAMATALDADGALAVNRQAFDAVRASSVASTDGETLFVTVQDTDGDFGLGGGTGDRVWLTGLTGLVKTLRRERPGLCAKAIDVARGDRSADDVASLVVAELVAGGPEVEVGYGGDGRRVTLALSDRPHGGGDAAPRPLMPGAVVVATGGGRGVTASALIALARGTALDVTLLGRTALVADRGGEEAALVAELATETRAAGATPDLGELRRMAAAIVASRQIRATLAALAASGSKARYMAVDVRDRAALEAALGEVRRLSGPIAALVHGAGVIRDRRVPDKSDEEFDEVFATKVVGARNLLQATGQDPLRHIAFFSSIAARVGNAGQADYAMANEILGRLAARERVRRGDDAVVLALAWGPWRGGMVGPQLERHFAQQGMDLIEVDAGAEFFCRMFRQAPSEGAEWLVVPERTMAALPTLVAESRLDVPVSLTSHPYLSDHAPLDVAVVPMALAVEWLVGGAEAAFGQRVVRVGDLQVLHGIRLDAAFDRLGPLRLSLSDEGMADHHRTLGASLTDAGGRLRYRARLRLGGAAGPPDPADERTDPWPEAAGWQPWPLTLEAVYDEALFHGPGFRSITALGGMSGAGATAALAAGFSEWAAAARTDPLLLDGGLQALVVWTLVHTGRRSLPTGIRRMVRHQDVAAKATVQVLVAVRSATPEQVEADILWRDASGAPVLAAYGVQTHAVGRASRGWRVAEAAGS